MKKSYIYILASVMALGAVSCNSDDPNDATEKHVYAEGEAPYLRSDADATATAHLLFTVSEIEKAQFLNLKDFAPFFHKNLDMTVDETISALNNGTVVMYNINTSRQVWDLTAPNFQGDGWYYTTGGQVASDASSAAFTAQLNQEAKAIEFHAMDGVGAGTMTTLDFGFAINNGKDLDKYVRFSVVMEVSDPSIVECEGIIPAGDYNAWSLNFTDYDAELQAALGIDAKEFIRLWGQCETEYQTDNRGDDPIQVYLMKNGERVADSDGFRPKSTTNFMGWWLDRDQNIISYGDGCYLFLEGSDTAYNFGRYVGIPSGESIVVLVDFALTENLDIHITFKVSLVFE